MSESRMGKLIPWRSTEVDEIREAVEAALKAFAATQHTVIVYKPTIQINMASGGMSSVNVRMK